jgi:hypothetical protein
MNKSNVPRGTIKDLPIEVWLFIYSFSIGILMIIAIFNYIKL